MTPLSQSVLDVKTRWLINYDITTLIFQTVTTPSKCTARAQSIIEIQNLNPILFKS